MKKFLQFYPDGKTYSIVCSEKVPNHPNQIEVPEDYDTDDLMLVAGNPMKMAKLPIPDKEVKK